MYNKPSICSACQGKCCKSNPGCTFPEDFGLPGDKITLLAALFSGTFCIDYWEGDLPDEENGDLIAYFIRPSIKGHEGKLNHAGWGGECNLLTPLGCSLANKERPTECRHLIPNAKDSRLCKLDNKEIFGKVAACVAWLPYNDLLEELINKYGYNNQDPPDYLRSLSLI